MSVLRELRQLMPKRPLSHEEARWVAERQAARLRILCGLGNEPFLPRDAIEGQPKIEVVLDAELPQSGSSHWNGRMWQITLRATEPFTRQRYTLAHEYKHIIDFPADEYCYPKTDRVSAAQRSEQICDYFAACLLMPKVLVRQAWTTGGATQDVSELARLFGVSPRAMEVRLQDLGLLEARYRCRYGHTPAVQRRRFRSKAESYERRGEFSLAGVHEGVR